jgi:hypothetical protein
MRGFSPDQRNLLFGAIRLWNLIRDDQGQSARIKMRWCPHIKSDTAVPAANHLVIRGFEKYREFHA